MGELNWESHSDRFYKPSQKTTSTYHWFTHQISCLVLLLGLEYGEETCSWVVVHRLYGRVKITARRKWWLNQFAKLTIVTTIKHFVEKIFSKDSIPCKNTYTLSWSTSELLKGGLNTQKLYQPLFFYYH